MMAYTNSPLVDYKRLSPNHSGLRTYPISKITIHHMAGNLTVEVCGSVFAPTSRGASSNYGVGSDGRIGMYVEEKNRSWASCSSWNDNQAVTIEVANSSYGGNWPVSAKALASTIDLCVDICKRNGIKQLRYTGDKYGSLTLHEMYAATNCPGPYLKSQMNYICNEVNKRLNKKDKKVKKPTVQYRVRCGGEWRPVRKNGKATGLKGKPITDIAIKVSKGTVKYRVHVKGGSWLGWVTGFNIKDHNNGYAGNGKPIDAIQVVYNCPTAVNNALGNFKAMYSVRPVNGKFYTYQVNQQVKNGQDGYAGVFTKKIDKFKLKLSK